MLLLCCGLLGSVDAAVTAAVEEEGAPIPVPACGGLVGGGRGAAPGRVGKGGGHGGVVGGGSAASARGGGGSLHG